MSAAIRSSVLTLLLSADVKNIQSVKRAGTFRSQTMLKFCARKVPAKFTTLAGINIPQPVQLRTSNDPRSTWPWTAEQMPPQDGKVFIVTGATSGMGFSCAETLAKKGGHVIVASRDLGSAQRAADAMKQSGARGKVEGMLLDLASFRSITDFVKAFKDKKLPLNVLVNNAGVFLPPFDRTAEGFEVTIGINHIGHILLSHLLLDVLEETAKESGEARIVNMASLFELLGNVQWNDLGGRDATDSSLLEYCSSKLMIIMAGREMNKRLKGSGIEVFICQPGLVSTKLTGQKLDHGKVIANLMDISNKVYGQKPEIASLCLQRASTDPKLRGYGGSYLTPPFLGVLALHFDHAGMREPSNSLTRNEAAWAQLYRGSLQLINEKLDQQGLPQVAEIKPRYH